ncbi:MAG: hypothetical protein COT25_01735 [Candidatus Kerfeldbacteria bacterium CG08_land_8_20_14_0_20_42_7]|uniref:Uncharacterized protein n=1 Tax=Candidatus Kerfeldbacteria bacterium CG08_land_8_20_14_0_20_42_7 TaxID=2014245 RepID=A0A2H0YT65_9BACT|nr:MAG: hypothetical protein COT25_01735 [Candidatus Kerfeldbacteria bacterium CG08_land_8_20_14_0_20_42_7]
MEYQESTGYYVDTEGGFVTLYTAWYEITPFRDGLVRIFLVPCSLRKTVLPFCEFYRLLFMVFILESAEPFFAEVA